MLMDPQHQSTALVQAPFGQLQQTKKRLFVAFKLMPPVGGSNTDTPRKTHVYLLRVVQWVARMIVDHALNGVFNGFYVAPDDCRHRALGIKKEFLECLS